MTRVFIDGKNGTTGLVIGERLSGRKDVSLITLPEEKRKDLSCRKEALNGADVVFLCLPDDAAAQAVSLIENPSVRVIDASTAHRTAAGWAYGFPELGKEFKERIISSGRIAVPGCHASGFIALCYPLVKEGILGKDCVLSCTSLTGYSGGGKKMIEGYRDKNRDKLLDFPRAYALTQSHKHLKEMKAVCGLNEPPLFMPIVGDFYSGMEVLIAVDRRQLKKGGIDDIKETYKNLYSGEIVRYTESEESGFLSAGFLEGKDGMAIGVFGNEERILLSARYDNLGKGASGAAVECFNIITGKDEKDSLVL